ncbi:MAG TPA: hypothetical protein VM734_00785 [Kofleriaceae bacterium]|nr:hypothetical protein [Kofleriaceae bacterium]
MTRPVLDDLIAGDLHELAAVSEHPRAAAPAGVFRTPASPAADRTVALARWCADVAVRTQIWGRIFAHRVARTVTGAAAVLVAWLCTQWMLDPNAGFEPTYNIGGMLMLLAVVYGLVYASARRRFAGELRAARGPVDDAPTRRRLAEFDAWAVGMTVAGMVSIVPVFVFLLAGHETTRMIGAQPRQAVAMIALGFAAVLARYVRRANAGLVVPRWVGSLEHDGMASSVVLAAVSLSLAASSAGMLLLCSTFATMLVAGWLALRLRRHEQVGIARVTGSAATSP